METTGKALVEHWDWAADKGLMNKNTAAGFRVACSKVLGALGPPETVDIKTLDIDDALTRFQNLKKGEFKPAVLETYKRRFRHSVAYFLEYLDDPGGWKPRSLERQAADLPSGIERPELNRPAKVAAGSNMMDYPFPVREGQIAHLILPRDLRAAEVKRLSAFMSTLVVESELPP